MTIIEKTKPFSCTKDEAQAPDSSMSRKPPKVFKSICPVNIDSSRMLDVSTTNENGVVSI